MSGDLGFGQPNGAEPAAAPVDLDALAQAVHQQAVDRAANNPYPAHGIDELLALADPEWLLQSLLPESGFGVLYGPPGAGKSFVALDFGLCIAAGIPWFGRPTKQKSVVYVAGEGVAGMKRRIQAWLEAHPGAEPRGRFFLVPEAPNLLDGDQVLRLAATLGHVRKTTDEPCGLLVVDTLARSMAGGDENSAKDVGLVIQGVDQLTRPNAALVLHHSQKASSAERGSSSLRGAADVMIRVEPAKGDRTRFTLSCEKSKDAEPFEDVRLAMQPTGSSMSLVTDLTSTSANDVIEDRKQRLLIWLAQQDAPATKRSMRNALGGKHEAVDRALELLIHEGSAESVGRNGPWRACPVPRDTPGHGGHGGGSATPLGGVPLGVSPPTGDTRGTPPKPGENEGPESVPPAGAHVEIDPFSEVDGADSTEVSW